MLAVERSRIELGSQSAAVGSEGAEGGGWNRPRLSMAKLSAAQKFTTSCNLTAGFTEAALCTRNQLYKRNVKSTFAMKDVNLLLPHPRLLYLNNKSNWFHKSCLNQVLFINHMPGQEIQRPIWWRDPDSICKSKPPTDSRNLRREVGPVAVSHYHSIMVEP